MNIDSTYILERNKQYFCSLYSITLFVEILGYKLEEKAVSPKLNRINRVVLRIY